MRSSLFGAAVLVLLLPFLSCALPEEPEAGPPAEAVPDAVFTGFSREELTEGVVTFKATAERAEYFRDSGTLVVYKVSFEDRGKKGGEAQFTGQADKVIYHEDTGDAELSGYVRLYSREEDASFETGFVNYRAATQAVEGRRGEAVVVKVGATILLKGMDFFADVGRKAFAFRQGAEGVLKKGGPGTGKGAQR